MQYNINPGCLCRVFVVPCDAVDEYLKLASGKAAKVLLFLLRNCDRTMNAEEIADGTATSVEDVEDAMSFWEQTGLISTEYVKSNSVSIKLSSSDEISSKADESLQEPVRDKALPQKKTSSISLTPIEIAQRIEQSADTAFLFNAAETIFATPLNHTQQRSLILMLDYYGLSGDVILMLLQYCASAGKTSISYIETIARSWSENGINTCEAAEDAVKTMEQRSTFSAKLKSSLEISRKLTSKEQQFADSWASKGIPLELIVYAYEKSAEAINKMSFSYMDKKLCAWFENGLMTVNDVMGAGDVKAVRKGKTKFGTDDSQSSFDINAYDKLAINYIPTDKEEKPDGIQ